MKHYSLALLLCSGLVACGGSTPEPAVEPVSKTEEPALAPAAPARMDTLRNPDERYSYALGMDLGKAIANVNVPLNMALVYQAIDDVLDSNKDVVLDDAASEAALQDLLLRMQQKKEADEREAAKKSLEEQAKFLAKNILDKSIKVTTKGVQYKVEAEGSGISPKASDKVQVHYKGALLDGTEFDNSIKRGEPLEFPVNAVIEGWQDLLMVMKEGMKVKAWIPSALGYGEAGVPPMIPANALLVFEVELLKVYAENPALDSVPSVPVDSAAVADSAAAVAPALDSAKSEAKPANAPKAEPAKAEAAKEPAKEPAKDSAKGEPAKAEKKGDAKPANKK